MIEMAAAVGPGVWKLRLGRPESVTPATLRQEPALLAELEMLPRAERCPVDTASVSVLVRPRGLRIEIALDETATAEQFYGLGLHLDAVNQAGRKRTLRVNSDPISFAGDSHAPVPFIVSTGGYGILVDTSRYVTFYVASHVRNSALDASSSATDPAEETESLYRRRAPGKRVLVVDIPVAQGVDLYIFSGPQLLQVVQRYNLFSGGGCLPPLWGLGVWYRAYTKSTQQQCLELARRFRDEKMPCDVLGLEPGWQSQSYPCSFQWSDLRFPDPAGFVSDISGLGYRLNLWEHVFVHPESLLFAELEGCSGDYKVWGGLVPDLSTPAAMRVFSQHHGREFVANGISGFKLDECDNSDFIRQSPWSFPEASQFPSGVDGEQMHTLLGVQYQRAILEPFRDRDQRTYGQVRSSGAFAASLPFVLYSDLYDHRDFVRGLLTAGFSGLLWSPEVRHAASREDLIRRIQTVILSPQALINAWYIVNPPWVQTDRDKNNAGELFADAAELTATVRELLELRMSLVPYLYAAFSRYRFEGLPPFRSLVMDYPHDIEARAIEDQFMIGDHLLAAPVFAGQAERKIYLPAGEWYHVLEGYRLTGGRFHTLPVHASALFLFARAGAMVPLASPVQHVDTDTVFDLTVHMYGPEEQLAAFTLFEDDGESYGFLRGRFNRVVLHPGESVTREGNFDRRRYRVANWVHHQ